MRKTNSEIEWMWRGYVIGIPEGAHVKSNGLLEDIEGCAVTDHDGTDVNVSASSIFMCYFRDEGVYIPLGLTDEVVA